MDSPEKYLLGEEAHELVFREEIVSDIFKNAKTLIKNDIRIDFTDY